MQIVDGSAGEGGGQIFRTALGLSLVTGEPVRLTRIRAGRERPGLLRQHLTALQAAVSISQAQVSGDALGSTEVTFRPGRVRAGDYSFAVGTAGSASLVVQTILPALCLAGAPSVVAVEGGTHNHAAPPFEFLERAFAPLLGRMGWHVDIKLLRHGFHPKGGGRIEARVQPRTEGGPLSLLQRGAIVNKTVIALVADLPAHVAARELATVCAALGWGREVAHERTVHASRGPGNAVLVEIEHEHVCEVFTSFGKKGVPAERVAMDAARRALRYLRSEAPVGEWLADQLLLPIALSGGGVIRTWRPSSHCRTQMALIPQFLGATFRVSEQAADDVLIEVGVTG